MKSVYGAAFAALISAAAAKEESTFAVLRFNNKGIMTGRVDPIVAFNKTASHVHTVMGGSGFSSSATADDLMNSQCSNAKIKGDNSAYWFPNLFFRDEASGELENVEVDYVNVYYFFEPTDDEIKAFPPGLKIIAGDPWTRTAPEAGVEKNLDPSNGPINNVRWTCPRLDNNYVPLSWPEDSDGSTAGIGDPINLGEGVGFPDYNCDGFGSPLRADVHMPSCYDPKKGLDNHKENMAFPEDNGQGKLNCPEGNIHVPHLFYEIYWKTPDFAERWTGNTGKQPFVLSNGDVTGFSSHADFMAGWDEEVLQHIIDTCDAGTLGMDTCPGLPLGLNTDDCTIECEFDEKVQGTFTELPGKNPLLGWDFGLDGLEDILPDAGDVIPDVPELTPEEPETPATSSVAELPVGLPEYSAPATNVVENPYVPEEPTVVPEAPESVAPVSEPVIPAPEATSCSKKVHTVWETVTETANVYAEATGAAKARRHSHGHGHGHGLHRRDIH